MAIKQKDKGLISLSHPESIITEQYRTIRANIHFSSLNEEYSSLLITSPSYGEGKSLTAANLGVIMAQQGKRVLLVDADLRKPSIHKFFHLDHSTGLSDVLIKGLAIEEAVKQTEVGGLKVLPSGSIPFHPAEILSSTKLDQLIQKVEESYDLVLFDSSPILDVTDSRILANKCKGTILVLCNGKTKADEATEAKRLLKLAKANCLGVVFNYK